MLNYTFNLTECSIRVTVLLEYLALDILCSWVSLHNSLTFTQIPVYYCMGFLWWLLQLQTNFQFTILNGWDITEQIFYSQIWLHYFTGWVLCHISVVFSLIPSNHKRHSRDGYSIYTRSFKQSFQTVYPVGIFFFVKNWSYLHKSVLDFNQNWYGGVL